MSYVVINSLTVPAEHAPVMEQRFAARAGAVDQAPGFEHFELLRPVTGTDAYLVYTRWTTQEDYRNWRESEAFGASHDASRRGPGEAVIWEYEVV